MIRRSSVVVALHNHHSHVPHRPAIKAQPPTHRDVESSIVENAWKLHQARSVTFERFSSCSSTLATLDEHALPMGE
ncbi:hypothetical protein V6N13_064517 [Hibiscus sabdariffa]